MTLTREEILEMNNWRKLDGLVADKVMGFDMVEDTLPQLPKYYLPEYERTIQRDVPLYSSDISAAWEVVETLQISHRYTDIRTCADFYEVWITIPPFQEEEERTETVATPKLPEAICKAALLAVLNL